MGAYMNRNRREFIKSAAIGTAGLSLGASLSPESSPAQKLTAEANVSLVAGTDRREAVYNALMSFKSEIERDIRGKRILLKPNMHQGATGINFNMFQLAKNVLTEFTVIDGVVGMEGNGPTGGTPVEQGVVVAGPDVVAVDRIGIELMEIDYGDVGYLQWCSNAGIG